ncbi:MAG: hypothetical protein RIR12_2562 [Bacteroidota bacterium]|jgi:hypothetical protein
MKKVFFICLVLSAKFVWAQQNNDTNVSNAVLKLSEFLKGKIATEYSNGNTSYFESAYMENDKRLRLNHLDGKYEVLVLQWIGDITLENISNEKPTLKITSMEKGGYCYSGSESDGVAFESTTWGRLNNKDCKMFYLLLGNVVDAYRKATNKKYNPALSYQDRYNIFNSPDFLEKIEDGSTVRIEEMDMSANTRKEKKLIGTEVITGNLYVNSNFSYYGPVKSNGEWYRINRTKLTFIKDKDNNDLAAYKAKLESSLANQEQKKNAEELFINTQWHPISALITRFKNDAVKVNGLAKYSAGVEPLVFENLNFKGYDLERYNHFTSCVENVSLEELIKPLDGQSNRYIHLAFKDEYLKFYNGYLKNSVPRAGDPNPENMVYKEIENKQLVYRNKHLLFKIEPNDSKKGWSLLTIYEHFADSQAPR